MKSLFLSIFAAMPVLLSPLTPNVAVGQTYQDAGESLKVLVNQALQRPVSPWHNPDLVRLNTVIKQDPQSRLLNLHQTRHAYFMQQIP